MNNTKKNFKYEVFLKFSKILKLTNHGIWHYFWLADL